MLAGRALCDSPNDGARQGMQLTLHSLCWVLYQACCIVLKVPFLYGRHVSHCCKVQVVAVGVPAVKDALLAAVVLRPTTLGGEHPTRCWLVVHHPFGAVCSAPVAQAETLTRAAWPVLYPRLHPQCKWPSSALRHSRVCAAEAPDHHRCFLKAHPLVWYARPMA